LLLASIAVFFRSDDRLADDVAELGAFVEQVGHLGVGKQLGFDDESNPEATLTQLLETDAELVDEIRAAFCGAAFLVVRARRRSRSD